MVGIIIPTYNNLRMLKPLVKSLKGFNVYVVEDGQRKRTIEWLKTQDVHLILNEINLGVAPSWNKGIKKAYEDGCTHFAIFNDDIKVPKDWWEKCEPLFKGGVHMVCLDKECPIPLTGWFFIIDRFCIDKIGYFDEQFAPYCGEDDDYMHRYFAKSLTLHRIDLDVFHYGSHTLNKLDKNIVKHNKTNSWIKLHKKHPTKRFQAL